MTASASNSDPRYARALTFFADPARSKQLAKIRRGIEKEGVRCDNKGMISQKPHPKGLGSALTHPSITTDYSEALLEFITPVCDSTHEALAHLEVAHRYAFSQMEAELIWPNSMPCVVNGELSVPIADYGSSNVGRLKHVYRHGLWHRYGRIMQCIAGIHYNYSFPDDLWEELQALDGSSLSEQEYRSDRYFGLIRNFRRFSWLLIYLFGASPAVCGSFLAGREHHLDSLTKHTLYSPWATSLRMSDLGYTSNAQAGLKVCPNSVSDYIRTLEPALSVSVADYENIGVRNADGSYNQLNTGLLQIENEYYSDIRPKRVAPNGEKPLEALHKYGVEYVEIRCTDLNPFMPLGLDVPQAAFMDLFLTWCLLKESPSIEEKDYQRLASNLKKTVEEGRKPGLELLGCDHLPITLEQWGLALLEDMIPLAKLLDQGNDHCFHLDALEQQKLKLVDSERTPSAQVLRTMEETGMEFAELTLELARKHRKALSQPLAPAVHTSWKNLAESSAQEQPKMEQSDQLSFEDFLADYLKREPLV
ncbi:MAG: glutamate--cysteine ligase [Oceanobacter sp.]